MFWFSLKIIKKKPHRAQLTPEIRVNLVFVLIAMNLRLALFFQHFCVKERFLRLVGEGLGPAYETTLQRCLQRCLL